MVACKCEKTLWDATRCVMLQATHKEAELTRAYSDVSLRRDSIWQAGAPSVLQPFEDSNQGTSGQHINVVLKPGASQVGALLAALYIVAPFAALTNRRFYGHRRTLDLTQTSTKQLILITMLLQWVLMVRQAQK